MKPGKVRSPAYLAAHFMPCLKICRFEKSVMNSNVLLLYTVDYRMKLQIAMIIDKLWKIG